MKRKPEPQSQPAEFISVGRIVKAHGLQGEVIVRSLSDTEDRWKRGLTFHVGFDNQPNRSIPEKVTIETASLDGEYIRTKFAEVSDRNGAEALVGGYLEVSERAVPKNKWLFYIDDIIGMTVTDQDGSPVGVVIDATEIPASHVIEVRAPDGETTLIPFLKRFIKSVDTETRTIVIKPIPGLIPWLDN